MSNTRRKTFEQTAASDPGVHVWRTKGGELTVINLRNCTETLKPEPEKLFGAAADGAVPVPRSAVGPSEAPPPRGSNPAPPPAAARLKDGAGVGRKAVSPLPSADGASPAAESASAVTLAGGTSESPVSIRIGMALPNIRVKTAPGGAAPPYSAAAAPERQPQPAPPSSSGAMAAAASLQESRATPPAPASRAERAAPADTRSGDATGPTALRKEPKAAAFEFVPGTSIPGRGVVGAGAVAEESAGFALFHDPLWGDGANPWATTSTARKSSSPPTATAAAAKASAVSLLDIFGTGQKAAVSRAEKPPALSQLSAPSATIPLSQSLLQPSQQMALSSQPTLFSSAYGGIPPSAFTTSPGAGIGGLSAAPAGYLGGVRHLTQAGLAGFPLMNLPAQYIQQPGALHAAAPGMMAYGMSPLYTMGAMPTVTGGAHTSSAVPVTQSQPAARKPETPAASATASTPSSVMVSGTNVEAKPFVPGAG